MMNNRICLFGDSIARGIAWDAERQKYALLKDSFVGKLNDSGLLSIVNYAKFGCTISKGKELILQRKEELRRYEYVALEFGGNDCNFDWQWISEHPEEKVPPVVPLDQFVREYREVIRVIRSARGNPLILSLPPIESQKFFSWISKDRDGDAILRYLGDKEHIYRWHEMYNMAVCRVALVESVPLVDITTRFLEMNDYQECICDDGMHINAEGHQIVYEEVRDYFQERKVRFPTAV